MHSSPVQLLEAPKVNGNINHINHHIQLGYSLDEIAFLFDLGVFVGFENWKYYGIGLRMNLRF